jgi:hypothetical protein
VGTVISAKFDESDSKLLRQVVELRQEGLSSFVRRAVLLELARLGFLPSDQRQALGFEVAK